MSCASGKYNNNFNPRSPCGERQHYNKQHAIPILFQSTLSVWRATGRYNPLCMRIAISIHALRVESDKRNGTVFTKPLLFQSTLSVWRATRTTCGASFPTFISIHALRVESDLRAVLIRSTNHYFNPRSPCGERLLERHPSIYLV